MFLLPYLNAEGQRGVTHLKNDLEEFLVCLKWIFFLRKIGKSTGHEKIG